LRFIRDANPPEWRPKSVTWANATEEELGQGAIPIGGLGRIIDDDGERVEKAIGWRGWPNITFWLPGPLHH